MTNINAIFIIDDDPITVFGIKKMLSNIGFSKFINSFKNGKLALDEIKEMLVAEETIPEVIFLDLNMPIMDGWTFLEGLIALPITKKIKVNIVTSSIDPVDQKKSFYFNEHTHHSVKYATKPIKKSEIELMVQST